MGLRETDGAGCLMGVLLVAMVTLVAFAGFLIGTAHERRNAMGAGAAEYRYDPMTHEFRFRYLRRE